jgi:5-(carboxyamino)imidazole ribonucleotide synthase
MMAPGSIIGIIGGGQLARMMILEGRKFGYRFIVQDPNEDCACANLVDELIVKSWSDLTGAIALSKKCDVVTIDTEHVPWQSMEAMEEHTQVFPTSKTLKTIQDRWRQREFLTQHNLSQTKYANVETAEMLTAAGQHVGYPCVLKTRTSGYDGKGQVLIQREQDLQAAWQRLNEVPCILEAFVHFDAEVSVVIARTPKDTKTYNLARNIHKHHILHQTIVPSGFPDDIQERCFALAHTIVDGFQYEGVMGIEMFVTRKGEVWVNELAPRTHNSGHFTYGGCITSQFEQHIRAITGQALGSTDLISPVVMTNLLGEQFQAENNHFAALTKDPNVTLHVYGKHPAKPGRKMGHFLVRGSSVENIQQRANQHFQSISA